jgi:Aspartyl/Asparaginyl beta-hydroxylase
MKIELLERGLDVTAVQTALRQHPDLWNEHTARTESPDSPHHGLDDIWVRFADSGGRNVGGQEHDSIWYESAYLLGVIPIVDDLMRRYRGEKLGGVLITRIPPGRNCRPHVDTGWHARTYEKFAIQIEAAPGQKFCFEGEQLETEPGDLFWFDNSFTHWVLNPTDRERVTMIVCIKR